MSVGLSVTSCNLYCPLRYPIYQAHGDQSTSTKDIIHWAQLLRYKRVQKFDYGSEKANMARYNQTTPPLYNITNMRVPTVLVAGGNDWLGQWKVAQLKYLGHTLCHLSTPRIPLGCYENIFMAVGH